MNLENIELKKGNHKNFEDGGNEFAIVCHLKEKLVQVEQLLGDLAKRTFPGEIDSGDALLLYIEEQKQNSRKEAIHDCAEIAFDYISKWQNLESLARFTSAIRALLEEESK